MTEHSFAAVTRVTAPALNETNNQEKKWYTEDIWQNFHFYRILNNEIVKMEVELTNFVTHLIITVLNGNDYL